MYACRWGLKKELQTLFKPSKLLPDVQESSDLSDHEPYPYSEPNPYLAALIGMTGIHIDGDGASDGHSMGSPSVATSAITLQSTVHSRNRAKERQIVRHDMQAAVKHGEAQRSHTGNWLIDDGKTCVVIASNGDDESKPVSHGKRVVSAWRKGKSQ